MSCRTANLCVFAALAWAVAALAVPPARAADVADPAQLAFFESKIRPVLSEHCHKCHSAKSEKVKGGLLLDSRDAMVKGGDSGPSLVPGDPDKSRLIEAVRYTNEDMQMPPKRRLSAAVVKDLETWVKAGAAWPAEAHGAPLATTTKPAGPDYGRLRRGHWAYQPVRSTSPPRVKDAGWPRNDVDRFVLANLESQSLKPVPDADRVSLVRRLYFDLIGLPPTPHQMDEFVNDSSPAAYERLVDRLLASPQFGERWGRHWLDVARFGESLTLRGFVLKDAWRYRDYVIESFNADRPFDRFMREQVSGDLMPAENVEEKRRQMVGTTFLAVGNTNLEEQDKKQLRMDAVDEQLDVIGKAFLAQTIGCARCHDHKFDPIPTKDYYALAGILRSTRTLEHANVSKWMEVPLPEDPAREAELRKHEAAVAALQQQIKDAKAVLAKVKMKDADKLPKVGKPAAIALASLPGIVVDDAHAKVVGDWSRSKVVASFIGDGYLTDDNKDKGEKTATFQPELPHSGKYEVRLAYTPSANRATNVPVTVFSADGDKVVTVNEQEAPPADGQFLSLGQYNFEKSEQGYVRVSNEGTNGYVIADAVQFVPVEQLAVATTDTPAPPTGKGKAAAKKAAKAVRAGPTTAPTTAPAVATDDDVKRLEAELKQLTDSGPKRQTVIAVVEETGKEVGDTKVHVRGSVHNLGDAVPRGFLTCVPVARPPAVPAGQSGRLELGEWLAAPDNPLPARVMANRCWHWLMGQGIVRTVDNFGTTGEAPANPELLDYLAARFIEDGWTVKKLVRRIVLSRAYQLSTASDAKALATDPEGRLCWRMPRRRLDAECIRDAMLLVGGNLDLTAGGQSFPASVSSDYNFKQAGTRRSVYVPAFRNALPDVFEAFDVADPSMVTGRRNVSTVAPQALFLMNSPFVRDQAKAAAARLLAEPGLDDAGRVALAYRMALGRVPAEGERQAVAQFLSAVGGGDAKPAGRQAAWTEVFHALFASPDFRYVE